MHFLAAIKLPEIHQHRFWLSILLVFSITPASLAWDLYPRDPLGLARDNGIMRPDSDCPPLPSERPLSLADAVNQSFCRHPQARSAWASIRLQLAQLGVARAAALPSLKATMQGNRAHDVTQTPNLPALSTDQSSSFRSDSVSLSWMLFDFGAINASVRSAQALLAAAMAGREDALYKLFVSTSRDYYQAAAAQSALEVARQNEEAAQKTVQNTRARVAAGVAPISDQLQASTALSQASIARIRAEGQWHEARGNLALDMGGSVDQTLLLDGLPMVADTADGFTENIHALLEQAAQRHPSILAARAQRDAAQAKVTQASAEGSPQLSLTASASRNTQPLSLGAGLPRTPARSQDRAIGIQLTIPLLDGFSRTYQIRQAQAQVELADSRLGDAHQQVQKEVWNAFQGLQDGTATFRAAQEWLHNAEAAYKAGEARYRRGVGDILELLNVQTGLANARQQAAQATADWYAARYRLAAALGSMQVD